MGCTTSSLSFRDVYTDLQQRWSLDAREYRKLEPGSIDRRTQAFTAHADDTAQHASQQLCRGGSPRFVCDPLLVPQAAHAAQPGFLCATKGGPYPYNRVLFRRLVAAVAAEHAVHTASENFVAVRESGLLARWDYRLWMVACCEFYHVLAILQEQKALPKETAKAMNAVTSLMRQDAAAAGQSEACAAAWKAGVSVQLTVAALAAPVVEQLRAQMPAVVASAKSGSTGGEATAMVLVQRAREYERRMARVCGPSWGNPLGGSDGVPPSSVPLLVFAEWAALQYALSFCGAEEDYASYGVVVKSTSSADMQHEPVVPQRKAQETELVRPHETRSWGDWCANMTQLRVVEQEVAGLKSQDRDSTAFLQLVRRREALEEEACEVVACWRGDKRRLTAAAAEELCWRVVRDSGAAPTRAAHAVLSSKAFECAVGKAGFISTDTELCHYFRYYAVLLDFYHDVLREEWKRSGMAIDAAGDAPLPAHISSDALRMALAAAQARGDVSDELTPPASTATHALLSTEVLLDVVRLLCSSTGSDDDGDGTGPSPTEDGELDHDAAAPGAADGDAAASPLLPLRPIDELRSRIGVDVTRQQRAYTAAFLCAVFRRDGSRFRKCPPALAKAGLQRSAELPLFTRHAASVAALVLRYSVLEPRTWSAVAGGDVTQNEAIATWLFRLRSESLDRLSLTESPTHMELLVHALFCAAAAQRVLEDVVREGNTHAGAIGNSGGALGSDAEPRVGTWISRHDFLHAVPLICEQLGCPAETLLSNIAALFDAQGTTSTSHVVDPGFTVDGAFTALRDATLKALAWRVRGAGEALVAGGEGDEDDEQTAAPSGIPAVMASHIVFVMMFNYTRQHCSAYWSTRRRYDDDADALPAAAQSHGEPPQWAAKDTLLALSRALPLRSLAGCYRVFAQLCDAPAQPQTPQGTPAVPPSSRAAFLHAFYERYRTYFDELHLSEDEIQATGTAAIEYLTHQSGRVEGEGGERGITRRDFSAFLQFVLGDLMTSKAYELRCAAQGGAGEVFLSEQEFCRLTACLGRFAEGEDVVAPSLAEAHSWLRARKLDDTGGGFISLRNVHLWYSAYRVEHYALESLHEVWQRSHAQRIPFTVSAEHRRERQSAMREILRVKQHREHLPESYPVEASEDEDGYLPVDITAAVADRRWSFDAITTRVFGMDEPPVEEGPMPVATGSDFATEGDDSGDNGGEGAAATAQRTCAPVPQWIAECVGGCNEVLHRTDLGSREVHRSDFRFSLQYVHHFVSAYLSLYYALAVLEATSVVVTADDSARRVATSAADDEAKLTRLFSESILPLLPMPSAVTDELTGVLAAVVTDTLGDARADGVVADATCRRGAHTIATFLVTRSHLISSRARQSYLDNLEKQDLRANFITQGAFLGALGSFEASAKLSYWERLRLLLPFGPSQRHRQRRLELFAWMDHRQRGYLTMSDIARGLTDLIQLQSFRADFTPALLRAFRATKDVSGERLSIVYLTQHSEEQVLMPSELDAFLSYLYRYLELYFMFDVLTCGGHVHPETLHVVQKKLQYEKPGRSTLGQSQSSSSSAAFISSAARAAASRRGGNASNSGAAASRRASPVPLVRSAAVALYEASMRPFQITLEAASMKKEVTLAQFQLARQLLRRWGAHVENPVDVFGQINRRCRENGTMLFTGFAIWASEHDLRPEGYGYGYDDSVDMMARMEEDYASQ